MKNYYLATKKDSVFKTMFPFPLSFDSSKPVCTSKWDEEKVKYRKKKNTHLTDVF